MKFVAKFKDRLQQALDLRGMNRDQLAQKCETTSGASLSRYANGIGDPKLATIKEIAYILGVDPVWLMGCDVPINIVELEKRRKQIEFMIDGLNETELEQVIQILYIIYPHRFKDLETS